MSVLTLQTDAVSTQWYHRRMQTHTQSRIMNSQLGVPAKCVWELLVCHLFCLLLLGGLSCLMRFMKRLSASSHWSLTCLFAWSLIRQETVKREHQMRLILFWPAQDFVSEFVKVLQLMHFGPSELQERNQIDIFFTFSLQICCFCT